MSGVRKGVDVGWAYSVFQQLCGGGSSLTVEPLSRAIREMMQPDSQESPLILASQLLSTMDIDGNGIITFDEFLALSLSNPDFFDQLMGFAPQPADQTTELATDDSFEPDSARAQLEFTVVQLRDYITSLERDLNQVQHEKDMLSATMQSQLADTEGDVSDLMRGVKEKDDAIKTLKEENMRLKVTCQELQDLQGINTSLETKVLRLQAQLHEHDAAEQDKAARRSNAVSMEAVKLENELQNLRAAAEQRENDLLSELKHREVDVQVALARCRTQEDAFAMLQAEMVKMRDKASESEFLKRKNTELKDMLDELMARSPSDVTQTPNRNSFIAADIPCLSDVLPAEPRGADDAVPSLADNFGFDMLKNEMQEVKDSFSKERSRLQFSVECVEMQIIALQRQLVEQVTYTTELEQEYREMKSQVTALGSAFEKAKSIVDHRSVFSRLFSKAPVPATSPRSEHRHLLKPNGVVGVQAAKDTKTLVQAPAAAGTSSPTAESPKVETVAPSSLPPQQQQASGNPQAAAMPSIADGQTRDSRSNSGAAASANKSTPTSASASNSSKPPASARSSEETHSDRKQALTGLSGLLNRFRKGSSDAAAQPAAPATAPSSQSTQSTAPSATDSTTASGADSAPVASPFTATTAF